MEVSRSDNLVGSLHTRASLLDTVLWGYLTVPLLAIAAYFKLVQPGFAGEALAQSRLVPHTIAQQTATGIGLLELALALALLLKPTRRAAQLVTALLFTLFSTYHIFRDIQGLQAPCACLGPLVHVPNPVFTVATLLFTIALVTQLAFSRNLS